MSGTVTKAEKDEAVGNSCSGMAGVLTHGLQAGKAVHVKDDGL